MILISLKLIFRLHIPETVVADIKFIKSCKNKNITPTFAKVNLYLKHGNYKLQLRIARIVMETELQNKHREKSKLKKEIKHTGVQLKNELGLILYNTLIHQIIKPTRSRHIAVSSRHKNKLEAFWERQHTPKQQNEEKIKETNYTQLFILCFVTRRIFCLIIWTGYGYSK